MSRTELAERVAKGLGLELPDPLPKVLSRTPRPEVTASPALSLLARPGAEDISTRRIAILVADGIDGDSVTRLHGALAERGAVPRFVGAALGQVQTSTGDAIDVEISLETGPSVLWDAVVLPDGEDGDQGAVAARSSHGVREGSIPSLQADLGARRSARSCSKPLGYGPSCPTATLIPVCYISKDVRSARRSSRSLQRS